MRIEHFIIISAENNVLTYNYILQISIKVTRS